MFLKVAAGFLGKGNVVSKILAIVLSSVALAVFALASMAFTFREDEFLAYTYGYFLEEHPYLVFHSDLVGYDYLDKEDVAYIKKETEIDYLSAFSICYSMTQNFYGYLDLLLMHQYDITEKLGELSRGCGVYGSEELYHKMGYDVLKGTYPVGARELMISKQVFEGFLITGLANPVGEDERGEPIYEQIPIESYADIIGKKIAVTEDFYTVTGVFDDEAAKAMDAEWEYLTPSRAVGCARYILSEAYVNEEFSFGNRNHVKYLFAPTTRAMTKLKTTRKLIQTSQYLLMKNVNMEIYGDDLKYFNNLIGAYDWDFYLTYGTYESQSNEMGRAKFFAKVLGIVCAAVMGFAFVLDVYLVTDIVFSRRRQIGVLQALGYRRGKIVGMMLGAVFLLSLFIFLTALLFTVTLYYSWFRPLVTLGKGVLFEFTFETALILFLSSVAVPLLSAAVPILLFFKKPIVDNIKARE